MILHISDEDYQPMETFVLRWRGDNPHSTTMTAEERRRIYPLKASKAKEVWQTSRQFDSRGDKAFRPNRSLFREIVELSATAIDDDKVREWLAVTVPKTNLPIFISWQPEVAVMTDQSTLIQRWDTFCYPASDDVSIWPMSLEWVIYYWHEEVLYVAKV